MTLEELSKLTIKQIKAFPDKGDAFICLLLNDKRKGVRDYGNSLLREKEKKERLLEETKQKKEIELRLAEHGFNYICGIDEVGRGPLAGPVVTAAVIMPKESCIIGINDSKKLSKKQREELAEKIKKEALSYSYGSVSSNHIDEINILNATKKAMISAIARLNPKPDLLLIDAVKLNTEIEELSIIKGDEQSYSIGAASILAKVKRDKYMEKMDLIYPEYDFKNNVGYGTKNHLKAIKKFGLTPIHRKTFCSKFL